MKLVMNMVRKPFKQGDLIFETSERSDELYLIHTGSVEIRSREGLVLATLKQGELFGEADPVLRALIRNLTFRLADANRMNEERWQQLNIYRSLTPEEIERPCRRSSKNIPPAKRQTANAILYRPAGGERPTNMPGPWPATTTRTSPWQMT